jgi:hypothetical protein
MNRTDQDELRILEREATPRGEQMMHALPLDK